MSAWAWAVASAWAYLAGGVTLYACSLTDARRHPGLAARLRLAGTVLAGTGATQFLLAWVVIMTAGPHT